VKELVFITIPDGEYGFSLAGISQFAGEAGEEENMLKTAMDEPDTGLIIIDERLIRGMAEERLREIEKRWSGILLVLPSPRKPAAEMEDYAARLIRRAIGYHVRLRL